MTHEERLQKAKIPCQETGITLRHTLCDICSSGVYCGVDAYVKDGEIVKLEGDPGYPVNRGALCPKGASGRQYVYREDRIQQPMRRVGPRGSGQFQPISWEEAFALAAEGLNRCKAQYGPEATVFLSGYPKWYRTFLQRLAYSFGSPNYMTESSSCWWSVIMAARCIFGHGVMADIQNAKLLILWGQDPFTKNIHQAKALFQFKERGGQLIVIDPRRISAGEQLADLYLRPRLGTDGYLAHAMARHILEQGLEDRAFIQNYVSGFEQYRDYVMGFSMEEAERVTGVPAQDIRLAAELFATVDPSTINTGVGLTHRTNGFDNCRALLSLAALCGRFDRPGTLKPSMGPITFANGPGGFQSKENQFINSVKPKNVRPTVGLDRFPLFGEMMNEGQSMDLARQILSGQPYPIKSAFLVGVNHMMYPDSPRFLQALHSLDFIVASDIFWTESCRCANIVLPACTSYERSEVKCSANQFIYYTKPAIPPRFESRDDVAIFSGLAQALDLDDPLLRAGYDACARYILEESSGLNWEELKASDRPIKAPAARFYKWGTCLAQGPRTPSGTIELYSQALEKYKNRGLEPLPLWKEGETGADPAEYGFVLTTGCRNFNAIHSRLHSCSWPRSLRPEASVDINPTDAQRLGIKQGDQVQLRTPLNAIQVRANLSLIVNVGELAMFHGYPEANVNQLLDADLLDPYTGFPAYKQYRCQLTPLEQEVEQ